MPSEVSSERNADDRMLAGECECGAVRYRVADAFRYAANCHCSRCRAATGSAFKAFAGIERQKLEITDGMDTLLVFGETDLNHTRCAACGSLLFSVVRNGEYVHVARWARSWMPRAFGQRSTSSSAPGATVFRVETDSAGAAYEAHLTKADGTQVTVKLDRSFNVTATQSGFGAGPGR